MSLPQRKPQRLRGFNYQSGAFFITICTKDAKRILSKIHYEASAKRRDSPCGCPQLELTSLGKICENTLTTIAQKYGVRISDYVIMPNHIHMILWLEKSNMRTTARVVPTVSSVIGAYKSMVAVEWARFCKTEKNAAANLWERSFYDHILRDEEDLVCKRRYIAENPLRWCIKNRLL